MKTLQGEVVIKAKIAKQKTKEKAIAQDATSSNKDSKKKIPLLKMEIERWQDCAAISDEKEILAKWQFEDFCKTNEDFKYKAARFERRSSKSLS